MQEKIYMLTAKVDTWIDKERERERDSGDALPRNIYIYINIYRCVFLNKGTV